MSEPDPKDEVRSLFLALEKIARREGGVLATPKARAAIAERDVSVLYPRRTEMSDEARRTVERCFEAALRALVAEEGRLSGEFMKRAIVHDLRPGKKGPYRLAQEVDASGRKVALLFPEWSLSDFFPEKPRRGAPRVLHRITDARWVERLPGLALGPRPTARNLGVSEREVVAARELLSEAEDLRRFHLGLFAGVVSNELAGPPGELSSAQEMILVSRRAAFGPSEQDRLPKLYRGSPFSKRNAPSFRYTYLVWMMRRFLERKVSEKEISQPIADVMLAVMTDTFRP